MTAFVVSEHIQSDSHRELTALAPRGGEFALLVDGIERGRLTALAVIVVLRRYGRALDPSIAADLDAAPVLPLDATRTLRRLRWRAAVDADARDWLVLSEPGAEPVAAISPTVGAALRHLAGVR